MSTAGQVLTIAGGGGPGGSAGGSTQPLAPGNGGNGSFDGNPGELGTSTDGLPLPDGGSVGDSAQSAGADGIVSTGCQTGGDCGGGGGNGGGAGLNATGGQAGGLTHSLNVAGGGGAGGRSLIAAGVLADPAAFDYGTATDPGDGSTTVTWLDISGSAATTVEKGAAYSGSFSADANNSWSSLTWSLSGTLPAGLTIDPSTGTLGGTSAAADAGTYARRPLQGRFEVCT